MENKVTVAQKLSACFIRQTEMYAELDKLTRNLSGKLAMSKGDFSSVIPIMEEKQALLSEIETLKLSVNDDITWWQTHKDSTDEELSSSLNAILDALEVVIKRFLSSEKQLQKQLDFYRKGSK